LPVAIALHRAGDSECAAVQLREYGRLCAAAGNGACHDPEASDTAARLERELARFVGVASK
jgi:hypothetical protein